MFAKTISSLASCLMEVAAMIALGIQDVLLRIPPAVAEVTVRDTNITRMIPHQRFRSSWTRCDEGKGNLLVQQQSQYQQQ
jgi:hypothetical protein